LKGCLNDLVPGDDDDGHKYSVAAVIFLKIAVSHIEYGYIEEPLFVPGPMRLSKRFEHDRTQRMSQHQAVLLTQTRYLAVIDFDDTHGHGGERRGRAFQVQTAPHGLNEAVFESAQTIESEGTNFFQQEAALLGKSSSCVLQSAGKFGAY